MFLGVTWDALALFWFQVALWQRGEQTPGKAGQLQRCRAAAEMQPGSAFLFPSCMTLAQPLAFLTFSFFIDKTEEVRPGDLRYSFSFGVCDSKIPSPVFLCTRAVEQVP